MDAEGLEPPGLLWELRTRHRRAGDEILAAAWHLKSAGDTLYSAEPDTDMQLTNSRLLFSFTDFSRVGIFQIAQFVAFRFYFQSLLCRLLLLNSD